MKMERKQKKAVSEEMPSPISTEQYLALADGERRAYRPVHPRWERLPRWCFVLYGIGAIALVLYFIMIQSIAFSDWFNSSVSTPMRTLAAALTSWIPFSLAEFAIFLIPLALFFVIRHAMRHYCDTWRSSAVFMGMLLAAAAGLFCLFVLNFAAGYRTTTLDKRLELERTDVTAQELYDTAEILVDAINRETANVAFYENDFSLMPYSISELNDKLNDAYRSFAEDSDLLHHADSRFKPVLISELMSYTHITGVYSFFTGEANVNVHFPDYTLPYTAAHEMAHQRGIAREDEANFVAFLVCIQSDDAYIRYSAYLNVYEYVVSALRQADVELYYKSLAHLNREVSSELDAYSQFYDRYRHSTISKVSGTVNNTFLQSQGTVGTRSYGMVVDLAVAYFKKIG